MLEGLPYGAILLLLPLLLLLLVLFLILLFIFLFLLCASRLSTRQAKIDRPLVRMFPTK
jgi:multidrug resistance efflux pump